MNIQKKIRMFREEYKIAIAEYKQLNELFDLVEPCFSNSTSLKIKAQEEYIKELKFKIKDLELERIIEDMNVVPTKVHCNNLTHKILTLMRRKSKHEMQ